MKKLAVFGIVLSLALFSVVACGKKAEGPGAGTSASALLDLVPMDVQGVVAVDFHRAINTRFADKAIKDEKNYAKYQEMVKEIGLDPQKDVQGLVIAVSGQPGSGPMKQEAAVLVSLAYNKDLLLAKLKKDGGQGLKEETYEGITLYTGLKSEEGKPPASAAFLDASTVVGGTDAMVRKVIDVRAKKSGNVMKNDALSGVIKAANKSAMVWSAFVIPEDATRKMAQANPMMGALEGMKAMTAFFDYKDQTFRFELKTLGGDETKNKQLADMLTGFKALGAGAAAKNPDVGELLNRIEISSGPDFVRIGAGLPEDILERLTKSAAQKVGGMMKPQEGTTAEPPAEEPKEEPAEEPEA